MTGALNEAEQKLAEALWGRYRHGADEVLAEVARLFHIRVDEIRSESRRALLVDARAVVAIILRNRAYTAAEIGKILNRADSSVQHLIHRIEADPELRTLAQGLAA